MGNPAVQVELQASVAAFKAQMQGAADSMRSIMRGMGESVGSIAPAASRATAGMDGLQGALRDHMSTARGTMRATSFFAREIQTLGLLSTDAAGPVARLLGGFAMGGAVGLAIGAVSAIGLAIHAIGKEAEEAAKKWEDLAKKIAEQADEARQAMEFGSVEAATQARVVGRLALANAKLAMAEEDVANALDATEWGAAGLRVKKYTEELERLQKVNADLGVIAAKKAADEVNKALEDSIKRAQDLMDEIDRRKTPREPLESQPFKGEPVGGIFEPGSPIQKFNAEVEASIEEAKRFARAWQSAGAAAGGALGEIGAAIGGAAGSMLSLMGEMIQKAIQLAIALSATAGPFGWLNIAAAAASILATLASIPKFERGSPWVPSTGLAMVHQGERIIPASENRPGAAGPGGGGTINVYAWDVRTAARQLRRNRGALARQMMENIRDRRDR